MVDLFYRSDISSDGGLLFSKRLRECGKKREAYFYLWGLMTLPYSALAVVLLLYIKFYRSMIKI